MKKDYSLVPVRTRAWGRFRYVLRRGGASLRSWNVSREDLRLPSCLGEDALPLTSNGQECFYGTRARRIVLPDTVRSIGLRAFAGSGMLRVVCIPPSVRTIAHSAFAGSQGVVLETPKGSYAWRFARAMGIPCVSEPVECSFRSFRSFRSGDWVCRMTKQSTLVLREYLGSDPVVRVPAELDGCPVVRLDDWCFDSCAFLQEVIIPEGVTSLGQECFGRCVYLRRVSLPDTLQWMGMGAFANCIRLEETELPEALRYLPALCFAGCRSLQELLLPGALRGVGRDAVLGCDALLMPRLPDVLDRLSRQEFSRCIGAPEDPDGDA